MSIWNNTAVLGLYSLSPLHYGTGQTSGAVDLPIARDTATGIPVLPASGIKGVVRSVMADALDEQAVKRLFGPKLEAGGEDGLSVGALSFTEARLLAYPARSLSRPFLHVTCPLVLEALARTLRATGADRVIDAGALDLPAGTGARLADQALAAGALVLEDLIYAESEVRHDPAVRKIGDLLANLLPADESATRERLRSGLVVIPDADFTALMESAVPVQARVKLTSGKTTGTYGGETGNLWYEEVLPSDCLFAALIGERRARMMPIRPTWEGSPTPRSSCACSRSAATRRWAMASASVRC
ncbi:type III-B CRISPR module RAMP protein Cmr4 [Caenispirillum bisanense]|uniref:type III-B CRISPR module RAMP protein Cmr4 n=1 Tax=Caenispirillum bisanense TaxID=414052 RepID=UPI0031D99566